MSWTSKSAEQAHSEYVETVNNITEHALDGLKKGHDLTNIVAVARSRHKIAYRHYLRARKAKSN